MVEVLENDKAPFDFDPCFNPNMNSILKKWGYLSVVAIGTKSIRVDYLSLNSIRGS